MGLDSILQKPINLVVDTNLDEIVYLDDKFSSVIKKLKAQIDSKNSEYVLVIVDKEISEFKAALVVSGINKLIDSLAADPEAHLGSIDYQQFAIPSEYIYTQVDEDDSIEGIYNLFKNNEDAYVIFLKDANGKYKGNIKRIDFAEIVKDLLP
jgi:hypothetical protein